MKNLTLEELLTTMFFTGSRVISLGCEVDGNYVHVFQGTITDLRPLLCNGSLKKYSNYPIKEIAPSSVGNLGITLEEPVTHEEPIRVADVLRYVHPTSRLVITVGPNPLIARYVVNRHVDVPAAIKDYVVDKVDWCGDCILFLDVHPY